MGAKRRERWKKEVVLRDDELVDGWGSYWLVLVGDWASFG